MGVFAGPNVTDDGLVLALDAGNNKSYSSNRFLSHGTGLTTANVTFPVQGNGTFQRVGAETVIGGYTVKPNDVVYSYVLGSTGCHYHGNDTPIPAGVYATFTFDYLVTGATTYPINNYLANLENKLSASIATANSLQDVWQKRSFTAGPTSSAGTLRMLLYPGACGGGRLADSGTIYYRNPRVEYTNVDTGTDNFSSMSSTTTWTDMVGGNDGTLTNTPYHFIDSDGTNGYMSFDGVDDKVVIPYNSSLKPVSAITMEAFCYIVNNGTSWASLIQYPQSSSSHTSPYFDWSIYLSMGSRLLHTRIDGGSASSPSNVWNFNEWTHVAITFENQSVKYYVNGNNVGNSLISQTSITYDANNPVYIGTNAAGGEPFEGRLSNVKVYNRALTASEIQQNFNALRVRFGI